MQACMCTASLLGGAELAFEFLRRSQYKHCSRPILNYYDRLMGLKKGYDRLPVRLFQAV